MSAKAFSAKKTLFLILITLLLVSSSRIFAQGSDCDTSANYLYWTGEVNNDFFNERNWRIMHEHPSGPGQPSCFPGSPLLYKICPGVPDPEQDKYPKDNTLAPGVPITFNLYIASANVVATGNIVFACSQKGITLLHSTLDIDGGTMTRGVLSLSNESTVHLRQGSMSPQLSLNFLDAASWVYIHQDNPQNLPARLDNVLVNDATGVLNENFRINDYYKKGSLIRPISASFAAATVFNKTNQQGTSADLQEDIIYSGAAIPNGMENAARSLKLKRGYMVTMAVNPNGTGKSRVYIASEEDLSINALDAALQGNVRFIRIVPWNWVTKKGTGGVFNDLSASWFYNWNNNKSSTPTHEYVPMAWGASAALPAAINQVIEKENTTHLLGFNESDNCNDQSGQYNNLCQPEVAVAYYENLMRVGVRLGSPAPREEGPAGWLKEFQRIAKEKDVRFDFVAVHWYDWGSKPANTPDATPTEIFNRFKAYLQNVHNIYHLPIWITEFNANPNRPNATQEGFLQLAIPYLESLDYVERYAYFQPSSHVGDYYDAGGNLTNIGRLYNDAESTPSMPARTYICANDLDAMDVPYTPPPVNTTVFEAECGKYIGSQWHVVNDAAASNSLYIRGDNNLPGAAPLAKQVHFEFEVAVAGSYRVYIRSASVGTGAVKIGLDGNAPEQISPFTSNTFTWAQVPRFYNLGVGFHRLTIEYPNANLLLDEIVITNGTEDLESLKKEPGFCEPSTLRWGLEATDYLGFSEAENASYGGYWHAETSATAGGGAYVKSEENITSPQLPDGTEKQITFNISIDKADEYDLWAKIQATNASDNSLWIAVDDQPYRKWDHLGNPAYKWYWKKFHYSYGGEDRSFSYFLAAGMHVVKIALASGNLPVDRIAVVTIGKLPETTDPNVLLLNEQLEFEAEDATILGTASVVNCATSSNGQQVTMGTVNSNGVRFDQIVAEAPGAYKLKVSYMSAVARSFRVIVNGVVLGRQLAPSSGEWCYNGGSPAVYELIVNLNRGLNVIDLTPVAGSEAPFIDKIQLERAPLTNVDLEAELAEIVGSSTISSCATASNGALVNPLQNLANGIRYNNLLSPESKTYDVDISYISKVARNLRISVNGQPYVIYAFAPSGNWCYEGGAPKIKTIQVNFVQGINTLEFRAAGSDAPFIDRIVLKEQAMMTSAAQAARFAEGGTTLWNNATVAVYPNPLQAGTPCTIALNNISENSGVLLIRITDLSGRTVYTQQLLSQRNVAVQLNKGLSKGLYLMTVIQGQKRTSKKLIVQ